MPVIIFSEKTRTAINRVIALAAANVTPLAQVKRLARKYEAGMVTNPLNDDLTIDVPFGYRVTYTHEEQEAGVCRHISVSTARGNVIGPAAFNMILGEFGFINRIGKLPIWITEDGNRAIIETLEPLDGDVDRLRRGLKIRSCILRGGRV